ncbi:hypothetical protein H2200_004061 [Cladophialophora chaetospira]|uniref:Enoyl reductase (ER) domain-containing protein n=1 Tax=Cladophialophora chaetospira TaxID=386627 RepID=A0AA38XFG6_9EURO|nr:hypothetical protein H2200_004061 [Cladophialophora chaetospira]
MKQWFSHLSGLDGLKQVSAEIPEPEAEEVLVEIHAVSLNYRDVEVCVGDYDHHDSISSPSSVVPCSDMVGTVVKVGPHNRQSRWKEGDRVMAIFNLTHVTGQINDDHLPSGLGLPLPGVLAEYRCFPSEGLVRVPDHLSDEEGSTLPIATATAWMALNWMRPIGDSIMGKGTTVLLQGTGGVSIAGLQIAKASGLTAIVTSSSDEKLKRAKELGADHTINYRTHPNWHKEVMALTKNQGVDIIFEQGGPETLAKSFACIKWGGLISCIGYLTGKIDKAESVVNTNVLALRRNVTLKGIWNGPRDRLEEALELYSCRQIHPVVEKVFEFDDAKEAFEYVAAGSHFGKVVIKVKG